MRSANPCRILYLGDLAPSSTSRHRFHALSRLGHEVIGIDQKRFLPEYGLFKRKIHRWTGHKYQQTKLIQNLRDQLTLEKTHQWDIVWVDSGAWCGKLMASFLKDLASKVVVLNLDDPTGPREPYLWQSLVSAASDMDAFIVVREETRAELENLGAHQVVRVWRCYDEVEHCLHGKAKSTLNGFQSDVSFIGTRMEDREEMLLKLIRRGVPISLWGNGWKRGRFWKQIKPIYRGEGLIGKDYVSAISNSKLNLCFLSQLNRDLHTQRSSEIPYAGGVLLASRTDEHSSMFKDGMEALLWDDLDECADIVESAVHDDARLDALRHAGKKRILSLGLGNEDMLDSVLVYLQTGCYIPHTTLLSEKFDTC